MFASILPFRNRRKPLLAHTADWSRWDASEAPPLADLTRAYEAAFGHPVRPASTELNGAPQLEIAVPVDDLPGLETAQRRLFSGEDIRPDLDTWLALEKRLHAMLAAHCVREPPIRFPATLAAAIAVARSEVFYRKYDAPFCLAGWWPVSHDAERQRRIEMRETRGAAPPDGPTETGHGFAFAHSPEQIEAHRGATLRVFQIDGLGTIDGWHTPGGRDRYTERPLRRPGTLFALAPNRPPLFIQPRPEARAAPPREQRLTLIPMLHDDLRADYRRGIYTVPMQEASLVERRLGRRLERTDRGFEAHIDLTDLSDWQSARRRLYTGEDAGPDLGTWRIVTDRLSAFMAVPKAPVRVPLTVAAALGLAGALAGRKGISLSCPTQVPPIRDGEGGAVRLLGISTVHPFILEKRGPDDIHWPTTDRYGEPPEDEFIEDGGFALRFAVDGATRDVLIA